MLDHLQEAKAAEERQRFLQRTLHKVVLQNTAYDDQGKLPCDEGTRVEILAEIKEWVDDILEGGQNFFWLTGDPGCGKSAITASLARYCKDKDILWAQFFINRNNEATTNSRVYFPSIAHQMAEHTSDQTVTKVIYDILKQKPSLLDQMSEDQALSLFVHVVHIACDLNKSRAVTIIIDGLDETTQTHLEATAKIFAKLFKELKRGNAKVFISSRTDNEITRPFYCSLQANKRHVKHVHLNTSDPSSIEDVTRYLFQNVQELVEKWDLNWEQWPGEGRFRTLCIRAGGLFIWAVTVVKFFHEQLRKHGHERLNELLDAINKEGMGDVNTLYGTILMITYTESDDCDDWEYERFRWIVGFIVALKEALPIEAIATLLDLRRTPESDPVDVIHFVTNLRTVLVAGTGNISNNTIPRLHKSFVEYITSERANPQFRIDVPVIIDGQIVMKCLCLVHRLRTEKTALPLASVRYAIQNWTKHLPEKNITSGVAIIGGNIEDLSKIVTSAVTLRNGSMTFSGDYKTHIYDPNTGLPPPLQYSYSSTIQGASPIWAIAVSSHNQLIALGHKNGTIHIWDSKSYKAIGEPLKGHTKGVNSICFSPDSHVLVSGSEDSSIRLWNCITGQAIGHPLLGHTDHVTAVCTDGHWIISGGKDSNIHIWDCTSGKLVRSINEGSYVGAVALSRDGHIAAGLLNIIYIWDIGTLQQSVSMTGHSDTVWTVAFSPDSRLIASGSADRTICVWNVQTGEQTVVLRGHLNLVRSVTFSPNGQCIASCSYDKTVRVWNFETGQQIGPSLEEHTTSVSSIAFLPESLQIISGDYNCAICVWNIDDKWPKRSRISYQTAIHLLQESGCTSFQDDIVPLEGHSAIISACYSSDYTHYAASTLHGHISIWNTKYDLIWETDTLIHPIHLLQFSNESLVISSLDGSVFTWDLKDGKPRHQKPVSYGPQITTDIHQFNLQSRSVCTNVAWHPFKIDAGLWAYVDSTFIRFELDDNESVTFIDVKKVNK